MQLAILSLLLYLTFALFSSLRQRKEAPKAINMLEFSQLLHGLTSDGLKVCSHKFTDHASPSEADFNKVQASRKISLTQISDSKSAEEA